MDEAVERPRKNGKKNSATTYKTIKHGKDTTLQIAMSRPLTYRGDRPSDAVYTAIRTLGQN
jgi:hypothetical protein